MNAVELLTKLVNFDTTSSKPNRACIDFIRDYLNGFGVKSEIIAGGEGKACLWATIGPEDKPGIVLAGHSDVVPVDGQNWSSDPFKLTERDGKLYGRGSCDMKAFIACVLSIVPELAKAKLSAPVHLAFTHDEEADMSGAANLTEFMRKKNVKPNWVWIGEPTRLKIIDSHKGVAAFTTNITGVPGHSGQPAKGLSAIELGNEFMSLLMRTLDEKKKKPISPSRFDPPHTTINLAVVTGGTAENIIPEHFEITWQTRAHPGDDHDGMLKAIESEAQAAFKSRFTAFAPHAGMKTCTCFNIPPLLPTPDNPGGKLLGKLTGNPKTEAVSFATEAGFFQKLGTHVVVCGPGDIDQAHKADEFVEKGQLQACIDLLRQVLLSSGAA
ncbi:MAG TPA: acetylornithine deacetylase [Alphaproteobacteria bacterium]|nr:acetylornithine deacetylase [Alphaproteobacteria bacterium]